MGISIAAFLLGTVVGVAVSFFNQGMGIIMTISIMGSFLIYQNEKNK